MKKDEKLILWTERLQAFQASGQTCREWCRKHQIPVSTMTYWNRRLRTLESESQPELVFAKMPTEQELSTRGAITENIPLRIFITDSIRIEIMPDCPPELLHVFVRSLKEHACTGRQHNGIPCVRSNRSQKKLSRPGGYHQIKISARPIFALYVCVLQPQADLNQNSSMGRIRFLDSDEKAGQKLFSLAGHTG